MNYKFEKVVGSTFTGVTLTSLGIETNGADVPSKTFRGYIWPDIHNQYDRFAKAVMVNLEDEEGSTIPVRVGYLAQNSPLYRRLKANKYKPLPCYVHVNGYSVTGGNDSYQIAYDADDDRFRQRQPNVLTS